MSDSDIVDTTAQILIRAYGAEAIDIAHQRYNEMIADKDFAQADMMEKILISIHFKMKRRSH